MKVLLSCPINTMTGYGTDGVELARALVTWGADVYLHPSGVHPPLPADVAVLLTKPIPEHVDLLISHRCPQELALSPESAGLYSVATVSLAWSMWEWCVDESTEIFTKRGWLRYDQLRVGEDETLGIDPETGLSYWQVIEDMYVGEVKSRALLKIDFGEHSSLTTQNHKWLVQSNGRWVWRTSAQLNTGSAIPRNAVRGDTPEEPKYTDSFVELPAWAYTEGWLERGRSLRIGQSHVRYPTQVARIRAALTSLFGPQVARNSPAGGVTWSERMRSNGMTVFNLSRQASDVVLAAVPDKVPSREFLLALTRAQLELFLEVSVLGDGNFTAHATRVQFHQNAGPSLDAFLFACVLAGRTIPRRPVRHSQSLGENCYSVSVSSRLSFSRPMAAQARGEHAVEVVDHLGLVWCPTTRFHNWLARRDGAVYFTGNSSLANVDEVNRSNCEHAFRVTDNLEQALTHFDLVLAYDDVSKTALSPYHARVEVLQGGVEPLPPTPRDWEASPFRFLMVGALSSRKNPFSAVKAFKELRDAGELADAQLVMKTTVPGLHPAMEQWCPGLKIIGEVWSLEQLRELYRQSHVLLAPSWGEGKNRPAIEFATSGGAVAATGIGGHAQWMSPDYTWPLRFSLRETSPGARAAIVDHEHFKQTMLDLYNDRGEVSRRAAIASRVLPGIVSWSRVLERLCFKLREIPGSRGLEVSTLMQACRKPDRDEPAALIAASTRGAFDGATA